MYKCSSFLNVRYIFLVGVGVIFLTSCSGVEDLSPEQAREELKRMTGFEIPENAENIRGFYPLMRDPHIFIKFETEPEGIAEVMKAFSGSDVEMTQLNEEDYEQRKKYGRKLFISPSRWQEEISIKFFDEESFKVGIMLERRRHDHGGDSTRYEILIDDISNIVYIHAWRS
jgi:hypothetical protein